MEVLSVPLISSVEGTSPTLGYMSKVHVLDRYKIVGFISSGTYGRVYKAVGINGVKGEFAIKKYGFASHQHVHPTTDSGQVQARQRE